MSQFHVLHFYASLLGPSFFTSCIFSDPVKILIGRSEITVCAHAHCAVRITKLAKNSPERLTGAGGLKLQCIRNYHIF